jgi:signal transduction histidine kinase
MRLLITVLFLIVLPTALLSVLAGRSIQARELILDRRLAQESVVHLDDIAAQMERRGVEALAGITRMFRQTVLSGEDVKRLDVARLVGSVPTGTVSLAFLYMNPWGYIYPEITEEAPSAASVVALRLQPALTRALSTAPSEQQGPFLLSADERRFLFNAVPDYGELYAGIEIDLPGLMHFLDRLLEAQSGPVLRFSVLAVDAPAQGLASDEGGVLVSDSLGMRAELASVSLPDAGRRDGVLASRRLQPPLSHIEIGVSAVNASDMRQAFRLQERLTVWGVILLAVVISGSAVILISGALRQAETARRRSGFMAGMSHDLRTPVAAMRVLAESLRAGRVSDEGRRQEFLEAIVSECDRLGDLIERVMFYFRQEQGGGRYEKTLVDADALVSAVAERFRRQQAGRVRIHVTAGLAVPLVYADLNALEKALTNLMDNAVKYGRRTAGTDLPGTDAAGGVDIHVGTDVRRWRWRPWTVLTVRDQGDGLAPGEQRRVFRRFYRGRTVAHAHCGGFGLGLSLVADIMKAHRGRVQAYNAPDGGAVFELWLRRKVVRRE